MDTSMSELTVTFTDEEQGEPCRAFINTAREGSCARQALWRGIYISACDHGTRLPLCQCHRDQEDRAMASYRAEGRELFCNTCRASGYFSHWEPIGGAR